MELQRLACTRCGIIIIKRKQSQPSYEKPFICMSCKPKVKANSKAIEEFYEMAKRKYK